MSANETIALRLIELLPLQSKCLNITNNIGQTALHLSVLTDQGKITRALILKGCDVVIKDKQGNTALHIACAKGDEKLVRYLINLYQTDTSTIGALFKVMNNDGFTCLHLAAQGKYYKVMAHLFAVGANVNVFDGRSGRTVLHYAVEENDEEFVKSLLTHPSINVNCETVKKETPVYLAYWRNYKTILKSLRANGADFSYDIVGNEDEAEG